MDPFYEDKYDMILNIDLPICLSLDIQIKYAILGGVWTYEGYMVPMLNWNGYKFNSIMEKI